MSNILTQAEKINLIAIQMDVIDGLLLELQPEYKQGMKNLVNRDKNATNSFIRAVDKVHSPENQETFGINADELRDKLEIWIKAKN